MGCSRVNFAFTFTLGKGGAETVTLVSAASNGFIVHPPDDFIYFCDGLRLCVDLRPLVGSLSLPRTADEWSTDRMIPGKGKPLCPIV